MLMVVPPLGSVPLLHLRRRSMTFQGTFTPRGHVNQLAVVRGVDFVGTKVKAPFVIHLKVYVLPMENVFAMGKGTIHSPLIDFFFFSFCAPQGTGVVPSAPSDSPDDFQTLVDLRKKAELYKIDPVCSSCA